MNWKYPKVDRHCHFSGMINPETTKHLLHRSGHHLPIEEVKKSLTIPYKNFFAFLRSFDIYNKIKWDKEAIDIACQSICKDLHTNHITEADISFSIDKYHASGMKLEDAALAIAESLLSHGHVLGIIVNPILAIQYHSPRELQYQVARLVKSRVLSEVLFGLDLVGDEDVFDPIFHGSLTSIWNGSWKYTRMHLCEMSYQDKNLGRMFQLPKEMWPTRVAHGIHARPNDMSVAVENNIIFDLAMHSNMATGSVSELKYHPISAMIGLGCMITLNTDDPVQLGCTIDDEYNLALDNNLISDEIAEVIQKNSASVFSYCKHD